MMFWEWVRITSLSVFQLFLLGAIGFFLVKKKIVAESGLKTMSRLVIEVTLPLLILSKLIEQFEFGAYPHWWAFPLISVAITGVGLLLGFVFSPLIKGGQQKLQFISLTGFQNSGYLPLTLIATLLTGEKADMMFIYLFLFLLGFNLLVWSVGVYMLAFTRSKKFELGSLFSPPVVATIVGLLLVFFKAHMIVPAFVLKPMKMVGDCTLPLALIVVGGNLAMIQPRQIDKKAVALVSMLKTILLPALGLLLLLRIHVSELLGLLIIMELAVPSATSLSVIINHYKKEDLLISQGIFFSHIVSLITIPIFLSIYYTFIVQ